MRILRTGLCLLLLLLPGAARAAGFAAECRGAGNDDTLQPYDPALHKGIVAAFVRQFPQGDALDARMVRAQTHLRCMDGRVLVCFTGANLPCERIRTAPSNPGATNFCASNPEAEVVPAYATGHDSFYTFRCRSGKPEVTGITFKLDQRGFAAAVWTPVD